jgi:hypothetical protein
VLEGGIGEIIVKNAVGWMLKWLLVLIEERRGPL